MKRIQNRIAESRYALPVTALYTVAVWLLGGITDYTRCAQLAILALATLMMVMLNNRNALIRIYSRMVSCSFLMLTTMAAAQQMSVQANITQLCFIMACLLLFSTYQDKKAPGLVYYAFLSIGIASVFFIHIVFYVPLLWILMAANLMAISSRMIIASILGLITPYWFLAGYYAYMNNIDTLAEHFAAIAVFNRPLVFDGIETGMLISTALIALLAITGIVHYLRNSYMDKIRTRMIYELIVSVTILTLVFVLLQPQHIDHLRGILIVCTATLIAHYIALTHTRITNISLFIIIAATVALTFIEIGNL